MNRSFLFVAALMAALFGAVFGTTRVQAQAFANNATSISGGLGTLTNLFQQTLGSHGVTSESLLGPYHFKLEKNVFNRVSVGVSTSLMRNTFTTAPKFAGGQLSEAIGTAGAEVKRWSYGAMVRTNYHVGNGKKFDPYFGAGIGYRSHNWNGANADYEGMNYHIGNTPIAYEFGIGARYYILPGIGVYAELGAGQSLLQGGLIMNLPGTSSGKTKHPKPVGTSTGGGSGSGSGSSGGKSGGVIGKK